MPTTGRPSAEARWSGPVSPPMQRAMRRVSAINCGEVAFSGTARRRLRVDGRGERSSPGPALTTTWRPRCEAPGDSGVALGRPALGAPAGAGSDERDGARGAGKRAGEEASSHQLRLRGRQEAAGLRGRRERVTGNGGGEFQILLDDMRSVRNDAFGEEPLCRPLARRGLTDAARAAGHAGDDGGTDRSLKVEDRAVAGGAKLAA